MNAPSERAALQVTVTKLAQGHDVRFEGGAVGCGGDEAAADRCRDLDLLAFRGYGGEHVRHAGLVVAVAKSVPSPDTDALRVGASWTSFLKLADTACRSMYVPAAMAAMEHRVPAQLTPALPPGLVSRRLGVTAGFWLRSV